MPAFRPRWSPPAAACHTPAIAIRPHGFGGWSSSADLPRARRPALLTARADQTAEHARRHADSGVRAATAIGEGGPVRGAVVPLVKAAGADVPPCVRETAAIVGFPPSGSLRGYPDLPRFDKGSHSQDGSRPSWQLVTNTDETLWARLRHAGLCPRAMPVRVARELVVVGLRLPIITTPRSSHNRGIFMA